MDLEADHWILSASEQLSRLEDDQSVAGDNMAAPYPVAFLTAFSAQSVISQLRQTTISPSVIHHINLLLDEIITSLISTAQSINPKDLRVDAVNKVFSAGNDARESTGIRSLARDCTGEAELELRSWYEMEKGAKRGFPPNHSGRGMTAARETADTPFPVEQAVAIIRLRVSELSSFSPPVPGHDQLEQEAYADWRAAGGDASHATIEPAAAWIHAFVERICENLLSQLNRVVERDSSIQVCGPHDLYTALAEDERFWGWFARMRVKISLDEAMKAATRAPRTLGGSGSPGANRISAASGMRESSSLDSFRRKKTSSPIPDTSNRGSSDNSRLAGIASVTRKTSSMSKRFVGHDRKDSGLSVSTKSNITMRGEAEESKAQDDVDEFDALVRSGETMKVSLTPSRLRTFESGRKSQPTSPEQPNFTNRARIQPGYPEPVPPLPRSESGGFVGSKPSPVRPGASRSRASSAAKLAPRAATTIEERTDEEDSPRASGRQQKKESLKELFDSEPAAFQSDSPVKRSVPAVILGGPPPGHAIPPAANVQPEPGHIQGESLESTDRDATAQTRRTPRAAGSTPRSGRSEAQELADFFNNTPPPPPPAARSEPPTSVKSGKGLRGFMSKVTGSGKKREEEARLARENAAFDIPTAPSGPPRHKNSMASVSTALTSPPNIRQSGMEDDPILPPGKLRKRPENGSRGSFDSPNGVGVTPKQGFASPASSVPSRPDAPVRQSSLGISSAVEGASSSPAHVAVPLSNREATVPRPGGPPLEDTSSMLPLTTSAPITADDAASAPTSKTLGITPPVRKTLPALGPAISTASLNAPSRGGQSDRSPSDSHSFLTADEGENVGDVNDSSPAKQAPESALGPSPVPAQHANIGEEPSIQLSRLVPARGLLQHATTADECRMLLSAYLSQLGVPHHPNVEEMVNHTAEAKVMAWLLEGADGPSVPVLWSPASRDSSDLPATVRSDGANVEKDGSDATPQGTPRQRPLDIEKGHNNEQAFHSPAKEAGNEAEELISETASMASMPQEDESLPPSFATSAMRSPVRLSTIGHPSA